MARRNSTDEAPVAEAKVDEAAPVAVEVDEQAPTAEVEQPEGEFDVEAWVAAVYDYQHNGGPKPVRTYRVTPTEALHVDAAGHVTPVERDGEQAASAELEASGDESDEV